MNQETWDFLSCDALLPGEGKPKSPIENAFYRCFQYVCFGVGRPDKMPSILCQHRIGGFTADFVIGPESAFRLVVECDGHAFHEKTKEQVAKDRQRQREIVAAGYTVIRYSGSEIFSDPFGCAVDALDIWLKGSGHAK